MTNKIQDYTRNLWTGGRKTKNASGGWIAGNAPCCIHNNETPDKRGRGGLILNEGQGSVSWHCFNCGFKAHWEPGFYLGYKFRKLLSWMGGAESDIQQLVFEAMRERSELITRGELILPKVKEEFEANFSPRALPEKSVPFSQWASIIALSDNTQHIPQGVLDAAEYVHGRGIDMARYDFYWSETMPRRVIVPFTWQGEIIGYSARGLSGVVKPKYLHQMDSGYVFNIDKQQPDWEYVIVTEGVFDALSIDAVAVLHAEINKQQIDLLESLNKEIVVVPHVDNAGSKLIDIALENGWSVAFPIWMEVCKDISQATEQYGAPFTLMDILRNVERSKIKIELKRRKMKL